SPGPKIYKSVFLFPLFSYGVRRKDQESKLLEVGFSRGFVRLNGSCFFTKVQGLEYFELINKIIALCHFPGLVLRIMIGNTPLNFKSRVYLIPYARGNSEDIVKLGGLSDIEEKFDPHRKIHSGSLLENEPFKINGA